MSHRDDGVAVEPTPVVTSPQAARGAWWVLVDLVAVMVFAAIGRSSHGERIDPAGLLVTAWPFLLGCLAAAVLALGGPRSIPGVGRGRPYRVRGTGLLVWLLTVGLGLGLRVLSGGTAAPAFVLVATLSLGVLLLGWRLVLWVVVSGVVTRGRMSRTT